MPYFNCTQEIGKPDLVPEEFHGSKSQAGVVPSTSTAEGISSSRVADNTGLIQDKPGDIMEDVAANVVKELIDLGMLQEVHDGTEVKVPASYLQLSILKLEKQDFVSKTANSPVRLAIRDGGRDIFPNVEGRLVRSLFIITAERRHDSFGSTGCLSRAYMGNVCGMRFLLVLDLDGKIACLPDEVGDLIHLRYLGLANSDLDELPRTLGNLQKLQTLDIRMCGKLSKLPIEVLHIQQLRHLLMSKSINDCEIRVREGIGKMEYLHTLSGIYGGDGIARELSALTQIKDLGVKRVSEDHASELFAAIKKMESLASLSLEAEECFFEETNCALFPELDAFSPPPLLQEFYLHGGLIEIPMWLASMENLTRLTLSFSYLWENPTSVLQLLPKLKHLSLREAYRAKLIGKEFCNAGGFPALETLTIASEFLVEWTEIATGAFPSLRYLSFRCCLSLIFLPEGLQNISTLQELHLGNLHPDLARRLEEWNTCCSPYTGASMSSAFGKCEQHDIMIQRVSNGRVMWPVVGQVIHKLPFPEVHHSFSDSTIRVIWRGYDLNIRSILIKGNKCRSHIYQLILYGE